MTWRITRSLFCRWSTTLNVQLQSSRSCPIVSDYLCTMTPRPKGLSLLLESLQALLFITNKLQISFSPFWHIFHICSGWRVLDLWFITWNEKANRGHFAVVSQLKREASLLSMQTVANLSVMMEAYAAIRVIFCHIYCSRWLWVVPMVCLVTDPRQWPTHLDHYGFI